MTDVTTSGGAFPTTNLYSGRPFYRSDLGIWCYYAGDWLTMERDYVEITATGISANNTSSQRRISDTYAAWIDEIALTTNVATTNDGSNYWTVAVVSANATFGSTTTVHTIDTSGDSASTATAHDSTSPDTQNPANYGAIYWTLTKTSSPGNINVHLGVYVRYIIT